MRKIWTLAISIIPMACAHAWTASAADVCNLRLPRTVEFTGLAVHAFTDRHGSYLTIDACPNHPVAVDYSRSGLYNEQHKELLKQMQISAYQGGYPIKMRISGSYSGSTSEDVRATVFVEKILGYGVRR